MMYLKIAAKVAKIKNPKVKRIKYAEELEVPAFLRVDTKYSYFTL